MVYRRSYRCVIIEAMRHKWPTLAVSVMLGIQIPEALADAPAGEKKAELCVLCHRADNSHGAPLLDGLASGYLLKQFELFKSGKRFGPAMQTNLNPLSTEDWQDIADYFASRPATRAVTNITVDRQAQELGSATSHNLGCAGCHGDDFRGTKDVPRLAGQLRNYLAFQMAKLQRDSSLHPPMSSSGELLSQPALEALATYFASLEP
jgi:cytochrome c553